MRTYPVDLKPDFIVDDQSLSEQEDIHNSFLDPLFRNSLVRQPLHDSFESPSMASRNRHDPQPMKSRNNSDSPPFESRSSYNPSPTDSRNRYESSPTGSRNRNESHPMGLRSSTLQVPQTPRSRTSSREHSDGVLDADNDDDEETSPERENSPVPTYEELRKRLRKAEFLCNDYSRLPTSETHPRRSHESYTGETTASLHNVDPRRTQRKDSGPSSNKTMIVMLVIIVALSLCGLIGYYRNNMVTDEPLVDETWLEENLQNNIRIVRNNFPSQMNNIWLYFYSGIKKVLVEKPTEPSVFLLIHEGTDDISSCLARRIASATHKFLDASKPDPLIVDGRALGKNETLKTDYGHLISDYRPLVEEHRIMILDGLQSVPASLARGLHIFCDNVTPLVQKAVYIFTLNISKGNDIGSPTKVAETELFSLWNQLDIDILSPLIARITGGFVFRIQPEKSTKIC